MPWWTYLIATAVSLATAIGQYVQYRRTAFRTGWNLMGVGGSLVAAFICSYEFLKEALSR